MTALVKAHMLRLRISCGLLLSLACGAAAVVPSLDPGEPTLAAQQQALFWIMVFVTVGNLVTVMPVYRAAMATPRRVYGISLDGGPLLMAHYWTHMVAYLRLAAVSGLGLVLVLGSGRRDWFWVFESVSVASMLLLWPRRRKVQHLLGATPTDHPPARHASPTAR